MHLKETPFAFFHNAETVPTCAIPSPHDDNRETDKTLSESHLKNFCPDSGSGQFLFNDIFLRQRSICWRIDEERVQFQEFDLHHTLKNNSVIIYLPAPVIPNGIFVSESLIQRSVTISILTFDGTIHQLTYFFEPSGRITSEEADISKHSKIQHFSEIHSLFAIHEEQKGSVSRKSAARQDASIKCVTDVLNLSYSFQVISGVTSTDAISSALWIDDHNLIIGTLAGQLIGASLPVDTDSSVSISSQKKICEFTFSDTSLLGWFWHGILGTPKRNQVDNESRSHSVTQYGGKDPLDLQSELDQGFEESIIAIGYLVASSSDISASQREETGSITDIPSRHLKDLLLVSLSADLTLAVWSYHTRSCIGTQSLSSLFCGSSEHEREENIRQFPAHEMALNNHPVTAAKVIILPDSTQNDCRILLAFDGSNAIFLLRGDLISSKHTFTLTVTREFTVHSNLWGGGSVFPKFVDLCFDQGRMYSAWRYNDRDWVFVHNEATRRTGPRYTAGILLESLGLTLDQWRSDESHLLQALVLQVPKFASREARCIEKKQQKNQLKAIDDFFLRRISDVPFLSTSSIIQAMKNLEEKIFSDNTSGSLLSLSLEQELVKAVDKNWIKAIQGRARPDPRENRNTVQEIAPNVTDLSWQRFLSWTRLLDSCITFWHRASKFLGFTNTIHAPFSGLPLLVCRNRVSWSWPAPSYLLEDQLKSKTSGAEMLKNSVLPLFDRHQFSCVQYKVNQTLVGCTGMLEYLSSTASQEIMNVAKHCTRLNDIGNVEYGHTENGYGAPCNLDLVTKLRTILCGEPEFQSKLLADWVVSTTPVSRVSKEYSSVVLNMDIVAVDGVIDEEAPESDECYPTPKSKTHVHRSLSNELILSLAFSVNDAVDLMYQHSTSTVLLLAYLSEYRPIFLSKRTLEYVESTLLAEAITSLRQWTMAKLITRITSPTSGQIDSINDESTSNATSSILGCYIKENNAQWTESTSWRRALSCFVGSSPTDMLPECGSINTDIRYSDANDTLSTSSKSQNSLKCAVMELVSLVYYGRDGLLDYLCEQNYFQLAISMMTNGICTSDASGELAECVTTETTLHPAILVKIGECFARDGHRYYSEAKRNLTTKDPSLNDTEVIDTNENAIRCFRQAIRCFSWCLPSVVAEEDDVFSGTTSIKKFLSGVIAVLKECIPRDYSVELLQFLWTVAAKFSHDEQVLNDSLHVPNSDSLYSQAWGMYMAQDPALQTLVWINIFKYSLENLDLRSAHVALMRLTEISQCVDAQQMVKDKEAMTYEVTTNQDGIVECVSQFVKKCIHHGHLDLLCEFQWASSEQQIDKYLEWHAAHCNVLKKATPSKDQHNQTSFLTINWAVVDIYKSLYALNMRNRRPVHAASTMYSLYLRLKWTSLSCTQLIHQCMTLQHEAIMITYNVLLSVPSQHRWLTRKFLGEEIMERLIRKEQSPITHSTESFRTMKENCKEALSIVTFADIASEMATLSGKVWLLQHRHCLNSLMEDGGFVDARILYPLETSDIIPLLLHSALLCCRHYDSTFVTQSGLFMTKNDKQCIASQALELIWAILAHKRDKKKLEIYHVVRSISTMCVTSRSNTSSLCYVLLRLVLNRIDNDMSVWELAARTLLDSEQGDARQRCNQLQVRHRRLPKWLMEWLRQHSPTTLLKIFLRHGIILEAFHLAASMIPDDLVHESEVEFVLRIKESNIRKLPWLPWNLFDALLEIGVEVRGSVSKQDESRADNLASAMAHFNSKLKRYVRYIHYLNEAQSTILAN